MRIAEEVDKQKSYFKETFYAAGKMQKGQPHEKRFDMLKKQIVVFCFLSVVLAENSLP